MTVKAVHIIAFLLLLFIKNICALVIVNPEETKIKEFNKGTCIGLRGTTPLGGHIHPISKEGFNA